MFSSALKEWFIKTFKVFSSIPSATWDIWVMTLIYWRLIRFSCTGHRLYLRAKPKLSALNKLLKEVFHVSNDSACFFCFSNFSFTIHCESTSLDIFMLACCCKTWLLGCQEGNWSAQGNWAHRGLWVPAALFHLSHSSGAEWKQSDQLMSLSWNYR